MEIEPEVRSRLARVMLLTVFRKTRGAEPAEVARALHASASTVTLRNPGSFGMGPGEPWFVVWADEAREF
jgi:hypothetical protein